MRRRPLVLVLLVLSGLLAAGPVPGAGATPGLGAVNQGFAVVESGVVVIGDGFIATSISESAQGVDLTGDADTNDTALFVYDTATGVLTNRGAGNVTQQSMVSGSLLLFQDSRTDTAKLYDHAAQAVRVIGVDYRIAAVDDEFAVVTARESDHASDLNGDGDQTDSSIVHVYDPSDQSLTNLMLIGDQFEAGLGVAAFQVREAQQGPGGADRNGDGDTADWVTAVYDHSTGLVSNTGLAGRPGAIFADRVVTINVPESDQGGSILNSDGDTSDFVLHLYDVGPAPKTTTNLGLAVNGNVKTEGNFLAFDVFESQQDSDINGDSDKTDTVLHVYDASTTTVTDVGMATNGGSKWLGAGFILFGARESHEGAGVDRNGDTDTIDTVLQAYDTTTKTISNLGVAAFSIETAGDFATFKVSEPAQNNADLNGDLDAGDFVAHFYRHSTKTVTNTMLAGAPQGRPSLSETRAAWSVYEQSQNGADLNGDGDNFDRVLHVLDLSDGTTQNLQVAIDDNSSVVVNGAIGFKVDESAQNEILNSDGDKSDDVFHVALPQVDLGVTKVDATDPVDPGSGAGNLVYTVTVTNEGPGNATGVTVSDVMTLPGGVTVDSVVPSKGAFVAPTWTVGDLDKDESATLTITLTVASEATPGTNVIINTATVTGANEALINLGDDSATEKTSVIGYCNGFLATHIGTNGPDVLTGTDGADVMLGLAGNDTIYGLGGDDLICAGAGNDVVHGDAAPNIAVAKVGVPGDDTVYGGTGNDTIHGDPGMDDLFGENGRDTITGGDGNDAISGGGGNDVLNGADGDDEIFGNGGDDALDGGNGNDRLIGNTRNDVMVGGIGKDRLFGGNGNDDLDGGADNDRLFGQTGADTIAGGDGKDEIVGGRGNDSIDGGLGNDVITGGVGNDVIIGGRGNDRLRGGRNDDTIYGGRGADSLDGGPDTDFLHGQAGTDTCSTGEINRSCETLL